MPSGPRIRHNNVFGVTTDNPLTAGSATFNSLGLTNLPVVSSAHAVITLDPIRQFGEPEIVIVTAHTAAAPVATITRGAYGTVARSHPVGTSWAHAPIDEDVIEVLTSSTRPSDPYEGQLIYETDTDRFVGNDGSAWITVMQLGVWNSWTPTWTNFTVGNGTVLAKYVQFGKIVHFRLAVTLGSTSAMGTDPRFTLPVTAAADYSTTRDVLGTAKITDTGTADFLSEIWVGSATQGRMVVNNGAVAGSYNVVSATVPMTWVTGDGFSARGTYETA